MNAAPSPEGIARRLRLLEAVALAIAGLAIYGQTLQDDFIVFDDVTYLAGNPAVAHGISWGAFVWAWTTTHAGYYIPLTWLSHQLDVQLFGMHPGGMAIENALLHLLNGWLVCRLLGALGGSRLAAFLGALFFVVHPLNVESVAWISQRKTLLAASFGLSAILIYLRRAREGRPPVDWKVAALLGASLLSKPWLVVFPGLLLILDWWPLRRWDPQPDADPPFGRLWALVREKLPLVALGAGAAAIALVTQRSGGAIDALPPAGVAVRGENVLSSLAEYLADTVRPGDHALLYPYAASPSVVVVALAVALLLALTWISLSAARRVRVPLAAWCWFLLLWLPVGGVVQVGMQSRADRFMYLPLIGVIWAGVGCFDLAQTRLAPRIRVVALIALTGWLGLMATAAFQQARLWRNSFALIERSIDVVGATPELRSMLATACLRVGWTGRAVNVLEQLHQESPDDPRAALNLAIALFRDHRTREACELAGSVLAAHPGDPRAQTVVRDFNRALGRPDLTGASTGRPPDAKPAPMPTPP
jgi:protein O-mannosyl-transferase